jgi:hypothetical protein
MGTFVDGKQRKNGVDRYFEYTSLQKKEEGS